MFLLPGTEWGTAILVRLGAGERLLRVAACTLLAMSTIAVSMSDPIWLVSLLATSMPGLYLGRYGMTSSPHTQAAFEVMNCR